LGGSTSLEGKAFPPSKHPPGAGSVPRPGAQHLEREEVLRRLKGGPLPRPYPRHASNPPLITFLPFPGNSPRLTTSLT